MFGWLDVYFICLFGWLFFLDWFVSCRVGWLFVWWFGRLIGWLFVWLVVWLVIWTVGWMAWMVVWCVECSPCSSEEAEGRETRVQRRGRSCAVVPRRPQSGGLKGWQTAGSKPSLCRRSKRNKTPYKSIQRVFLFKTRIVSLTIWRQYVGNSTAVLEFTVPGVIACWLAVLARRWLSRLLASVVSHSLLSLSRSQGAHFLSLMSENSDGPFAKQWVSIELSLVWYTAPCWWLEVLLHWSKLEESESAEICLTFDSSLSAFVD